MRLAPPPTDPKNLGGETYHLADLIYANYLKHLEESNEYESLRHWAPWDDRQYEIRQIIPTLNIPSWGPVQTIDNLFSVDIKIPKIF